MVSNGVISDHIATDNDEFQNDSLLWLGKTNERLNNFDVTIFIFELTTNTILAQDPVTDLFNP